jgi:hypothetical protein
MAADTTNSPGNSKRLLDRRKFLSRLRIGLSALAGAIVGVPVIGFLVGHLFRRVADSWRWRG